MISTRKCLTCLRLIGVCGAFSLISFASAQKASTLDLRGVCRLEGVPALAELSVSWTGACANGRASGFGEVYGFSAGKISYILRGQFSNGQLERQDELRDCTKSNCTDDIPRSLLQAHERAAQPVAAAVPTPTPVPRETPTAPPASPTPQAQPATPPAVVSAVAPPPTATGEREIRVPNATFRGRFTSAANGVISGEGKVAYDDGARYEGTMVNGLKHGKGTYTWPDGLVYSGDWANDRQTGRAKMSFKNGDTYEGEVVEGVFTGSGTYTQPSGDTYTGNWVAGKREGKGAMQKLNGQRYEGDWKADRRHGKGVETFIDGSRYDGDWVADEATGKGTIKLASGDTYTGDWVQGRREGKGVGQKPNGQRYEGDWKANRRDGQGVETFADGGRYDGTWVADKAVGKGDIVFSSGDAYTGEVLDGVPHGTGVYRWGSGDRFDGDFERGKPIEARGKMTFFFDVAVASLKPETPARQEALAPVQTTQESPAVAAAITREAQCVRAFNAASTQVALRRFLESFPDDDCQRGNMAKQKLAALAERERNAARAADERNARAKAFIGATAAYVQDFPFCVVGTGANCQRVTYSFNVKATIKDIDMAKRTAQVQVTAAESLGQAGAANPLFAQGRVPATEAFRARVVGSTQTRAVDELGIAGL